MNAAAVGKRWYEIRPERQVRFLEDKESQVGCDQAGGVLQSCHARSRWLIMRALPCQAANHRDARPVGVFEIASDTAADSALPAYPLLRTLQGATQPAIEVVLPGQETIADQIHLVSGRSLGTAVGR